MKKFVVLAACLSLFIAGQALAKDLSFSAGLVQQDFKDLSKNAGAALSYKNVAPATPLGITGFDVGVEASFMPINSGYWDTAFGGPGKAPAALVIPKLRARKGLPFGIDIGAMYSYVPDSNIKLYGAEVSYAILDGSIATPAVGIRGTYTKLTGVNDLSFQTAGIDASISKGFLILTPYAGAGLVMIDSKATGNLKTLAPTLKDEKITQPRYFVGLKVSPLPLFGITAEAEYSSRPVYSLKAALSF